MSLKWFYLRIYKRILINLQEGSMYDDLYRYEVHTTSFQIFSYGHFYVWALLHTWNSSPLRSNLLRLQCTYCTVTKTSGRAHGSPLVWACQWPSSQPLSSPQLSHNDCLWVRESPKATGSKVWTIGRVMNCLGAHLGQIVSDKDGVMDWCIVLVEMPLSRFEECWPLPKESLPELP